MELRFGEWTVGTKLPPIPKGLCGDKYLVTTSDKRVIPVKYMKINILGRESLRWVRSGKLLCPWDIIAYMPFPKPY